MPVHELAEVACKRQRARQVALDLIVPGLVRFRVQSSHAGAGPVVAVRDAGGLQGRGGGSRGRHRRRKITRRSCLGAAAGDGAGRGRAGETGRFDAEVRTTWRES